MNLFTDENQALDALNQKYRELSTLYDQKHAKWTNLTRERDETEQQLETLKKRMAQISSATAAIKGSTDE